MIVKCLRHQVPFLKTFSRSELTQPLRLAKYVFLQINKTTSYVIASHHKIDSVRGILSAFNHHDKDFLKAHAQAARASASWYFLVVLDVLLSFSKLLASQNF